MARRGCHVGRAGGGAAAIAGAVVLVIAPRGAGQPIPLSPAAQASGAVITHEQGIEFVTIGAAGNAPWPGNGSDGDLSVGRGSVGYEYRIGRFEVTTAQWAEFFNAAFDRPANDRLPHLMPPDTWGAVATTPNTPGGRRWRVPAGNEMRPTGDISWRMAAMYANWLHNDKSSDRSAFLNGAYDVSTFGYTGTVFTDQFTRSAGARYWIPSLDEMIKASHYDPNRSGPGQGGWWLYNTTSDIAPIYGPPGVLVNGQPAQANAIWDASDFPGFSPFAISLGAYPTVQSPWGLLDTAGATREWTEYIHFANGLPQFPVARGFDGSTWGSLFAEGHFSDQVGLFGGDFPSLALGDLGFRIAAAVPTPGAAAPWVVGAVWCMRRRRSDRRG